MPGSPTPRSLIGPAALVRAQRAFVRCDTCTRLRRYCVEVARVKRAAYRDDVYWGRPVPGFGDPAGRILLLGLAPAAHGANRTGRVFTGDGRGGSGDFLMAALHRAGLASLPTSQRADDGLVLRGVYIAAAARCAPPANKPLPDELTACRPHLAAEVAALPHLRVVVALGKVGCVAGVCRRAGAATPPTAGVRPRRSGEAGAGGHARPGRSHAGRLLPPVAAEHAHGQGDGRDVRRRTRASAWISD
jgi:uracil-DNA glycosylase family 4